MAENFGLLIDGDTMGMIGNLPHLTPSEREMVHEKIVRRIEMIKVGINQYPHLDRELQDALQDNLRTRVDPERGGKLVIERYSGDVCCWLLVTEWPEDTHGNAWSTGQVIELLRQSDMRRFATPAEYIACKRAMADKVKADNLKKANEALQNVIESLGSKGIQQIKDVERAIRTGEKITMHGDDEKRIERMYQASLKHEKDVYEGLERGLDLARRYRMNLVGVDDKGVPILTDEKGEPA